MLQTFLSLTEYSNLFTSLDWSMVKLPLADNMKIVFGFCLVLLLVNDVCCDKKSFQDLIRFLSRNSSVPHYRPNMESGIPMDIEMSIHIIGIHSVVEENWQLQLDCYLRSSWNSHFLVFPNNSGYDMIGMPTLNSERYIWQPDVHLVQARETSRHTTFKEDGGIRIRENGDVTRSSKMSFMVSCPVDLSSFPLDTQKCTLSFESYAGTVDEINLLWHATSPLTVNPDLMGKKSAIKYSHFTTSTVRSQAFNTEYQQLQINFLMQRHASHYIVLYYLPTTFLVILGGLLFWLPVTSLNERTFYGAFLFLSSTVFVVASQYGTPNVGYLKAIDTWCVSCMGFLFAAVVEVIVLHLLRTQYTQHSTSTFHQMKEEEDTRTADNANLTPTSSVIFRGGKIITYLDWVLKIAYPVVFVIFIIIYASLYH